MNPEYIIQLRRQLEAIKEFETKNASSKYQYLAFWGEILGGIVFLGLAVIGPSYQASLAAQLINYFVGILFLCQGSYLVVRVKTDRRIKLILEAILTPPEPKQSDVLPAHSAPQRAPKKRQADARSLRRRRKS